jgi:cell division protein FtsI (penicillin-binding protein 3)
MCIGQEVGVTPLQVVRAYSVIANGGLLMKPYIVSTVTDKDGNIVKEYTPKITRRVISKSTSDKMKTILKTVVQEGGTAVNAAIKGNPVAGKTGTAQIIDPVTKRYSNKKYVSSFVGFVPADDPKFVLIVVVYVPKGAIYGGTVAAPIFRKISVQALQYLDVPLDKDTSSNKQLVAR